MGELDDERAKFNRKLDRLKLAFYRAANYVTNGDGWQRLLINVGALIGTILLMWALVTVCLWVVDWQQAHHNM